MASQQLKRHQAVIWLPPRSAGEAVLSSGRPVFHAQIGGDDESERRLVSLEALEGVRQVQPPGRPPRRVPRGLHQIRCNSRHRLTTFP